MVVLVAKRNEFEFSDRDSVTLSGIADVEAQEKFGVCLVSITREHEREYRELERLKRNLLRERKWCKFADSANFLANLTILRVNEFESPLRQINFVAANRSNTLWVLPKVDLGTQV